jgi:hypothetical protein
MLKHIIWSCFGLLVLSQATLFASKHKNEDKKDSLLMLKKITAKICDASKKNKPHILRQFAPLVDLRKITTGRRKRNLLHVAAGNGAWRVVQSLLDRGMNPNERDGSGLTPLMYAGLADCSRSMAQLLSHGANPREIAPGGNHSLLISCMDREFIRTFRNSIARQAEECAVCLEPKQPREHRLTSIECLHTICRECKRSMIKTKLFDCPLCREGMDAWDRP